MRTDAQLLIRTHRRDLDWLKVCLQSAQRYWSSQYPPVIVATPDCQGSFPIEVGDMGASIHFEAPWPDQRAGANYLGLSADLYANPDAPAILITDSDCMFKTPVNAEDFMLHDQIIIRGEPWETVIDPHNQICIDMYRIWIKESTGLWATHETMRHHPFVYWREDFAGARALIKETTGCEARQWMEEWSRSHNSGYASEFNLLGAYCLKGDRPYVVLPTLLQENQKVHQFHSWSQTPYMCLEQITPMLITA